MKQFLKFGGCLSGVKKMLEATENLVQWTTKPNPKSSHKKVKKLTYRFNDWKKLAIDISLTDET